MTELTIRPEEIRDALERFVASYERPGAAMDEAGAVRVVGDGIAKVEGLPSATTNELLKFEDGTPGIALNLDVREIGVVVLGDYGRIAEGESVMRTGKILSTPVGDNFLGRVVNPLGEPIDGLGPIEAEGTRILEFQAPGVMARQSVKEPLQTGIKATPLIVTMTLKACGVPIGSTTNQDRALSARAAKRLAEALRHVAMTWSDPAKQENEMISL